VTAAVLGLIVAAAAYLRFRPDAPASAPLELWQQVKLTQLSNDGNTGPAAISPDGRYLAYVITEAGRQSLWIRQLASGSTLQITAPGEIASEGGVTFSPDGNYIYYVTFRDAPAMVSTIYRVPAMAHPRQCFVRRSAMAWPRVALPCHRTAHSWRSSVSGSTKECRRW
jgi:Tol biopolymer transport system component